MDAPQSANIPMGRRLLPKRKVAEGDDEEEKKKCPMDIADEEMKEMFDADEADEPHELRRRGSRRKRSEDIVPRRGKLRRSARIAARRRRDAQQVQEGEEEEYEARAHARESDGGYPEGDVYVSPVGPPRVFGPPCGTGPPWRDQYTGLVLPDAEVEEAMNAERASLAKFHVLKVVEDPRSPEVRAACGSGEESPTPIGTRWLIHRKVSGKVKARLVAQQIKWTNDGMDTFAATATSAGVRLLLAILANRNKKGED